MLMKRLMLATSVLALGLGGAAFAQTGAGSSAGAGAIGAPSSSPSYSAPSRSAGGSTMNDQDVNGSGANGGPMASNMPGNRSTATGSATRGSNIGASSDQVKQAQEALQSQGLYRGQVDGKWGPRTRQAVAQFQKQKGLKQTAQLDQQTMNDLQNGSMGGSDNMSSSPAAGSAAPIHGQGTPGNGPATSGANPGGMNGSNTTPR